MSEEKIILTDQQVTLLERLAVSYEKTGLQPAMAKILALLLVSDHNELSFEQIQATINLSKGATSQSINHLLLVKKIDYRTKIGDRKRYFFSKIISWRENFLEQINSVTELLNIHREVLASRTKETEEFNKSIQDLIDFLTYLTKEIPEIYRKFSEIQSQQ